jgi:adenylate cyclase
MSETASVPSTLDAIASCFEGIVPATICSCAPDGTPNVTYLSIVNRLDEWHVGLSYQFFNKTRKNVLANPMVQVIVVSPETADQYRLDLQYERTEVAGTFFDRMSTRLAAVAAQTGMSQIFTLRGVDVFRVLDCRPVNAETRAETAPLREYLAHVESLTEQLAACLDLDTLLETALTNLATRFAYSHAFVMIPDETGQRLYTIASRGYDASGVGSEIWLGDGILGVAAERRTIVRTTSLTREVVFSRAVRSSIEQSGQGQVEQEIPLPGLPHVESQVVAPLVARGGLVGILCVQSEEVGRFLLDDERVLQIVGRHLAASMAVLRSRTPAVDPAEPRRLPPPSTGVTATIKHYQSDDSVFVDDSYLIKGIAGRILWKLLRIYDSEQRVQFTNREIRLDASLQLPDIRDNLEARLILLRRRLADKSEVVRLIPDGRGRFRLDVRRPLILVEQSS